MLTIRRFIDRSRVRAGDDTGAILVAVVVVMLLGFLVAAAVAASVVFTIGANVGNRSSTQSFIAAESGRDAAIAKVNSRIIDGELSCDISSGVIVPDGVVPGPAYTADVVWATSADLPDQWLSGAGSVPGQSACPTDTSNFVVITSTGTANNSTSTVRAAYPWTISPDTRPAGTLAYFDSEFKATKSTYSGDLVIRGDEDYQCNNGAGNEIKGDLWVTDAGVVVTGDCHVTGSIFAYGGITVKNKNFIVGGDVITEVGNIELAADAVQIGGEIYAGNDVILSKSGEVGKTIKAVRNVTTPIPTAWTHADGSVVTGMPGQPKPEIVPTLTAVHDATAWLELDRTLDWGVPPESGVCSTAAIKALLATAGERVVIDMTGCGSSVTVDPGSVTLMRDALIYVPASSGMTLNLTGTITAGTGDPQLIIVHGDSNLADGKPTCSVGADKLSVGTGIGVRAMIYSPCGINNTIALTMKGQLYMGTDGLHLNGGTFTCAPMGWAPAFKNLSCGVRGEGGVFDPSRTTVSMGTRAYQTEVTP